MLPGLQILNECQSRLVCADVMAELVLTTMLVPFGIAYALARQINRCSQSLFGVARRARS